MIAACVRCIGIGFQVLFTMVMSRSAETGSTPVTSLNSLGGGGGSEQVITKLSIPDCMNCVRKRS